jgi:hypothetical protein
MNNTKTWWKINNQAAKWTTSLPIELLYKVVVGSHTCSRYLNVFFLRGSVIFLPQKVAQWVLGIFFIIYPPYHNSNHPNLPNWTYSPLLHGPIPLIIRPTGVNVMITIFNYFNQYSSKTLVLFLKTNIIIIFGHTYKSSILSKNAIFANCFGQNS